MSSKIHFEKYPIPCNYWTVSFKEHNLIKDTLLECLKTTKKKNLKNFKTNTNISETDYGFDFSKESPEYRDIFFKYFNPYIKEFVNRFIGVVNKESSYEGYEIGEYWFQKYQYGDTHTWHTHSCSHLSFVYFLELSDSDYATQIIFPERDCEPIDVKNIKEGDVLIFPAGVWHRSPVISKPGVRKTIISFNLSFYEDEDEDK